METSEILTTKELMVLLKVRHKQTIYRLIGEGLPAMTVGKSFRFIRGEVVNFLKANSKRTRKIQVGRPKRVGKQ